MNAIRAHRLTTTMPADGKLVVQDVPFPAGVLVEVIILSPAGRTAGEARYPLHGVAYQYDDPLEPAVPADAWEVNQ